MFEKGHLETGYPDRSHLPNLARGHDGAIFCTFDLAHEAIMFCESRDAGKTWSRPAKVMDKPRDGYIADSNILVVGTRIAVFATFCPAPSPPYACNETYASSSGDGGRTWSEPEQLDIPRKYVTGKIHVPFWVDDDTVAMGYAWDVPAEEGRPAPSEPEMHTRCGVLLSKDGGRTWTAGGDVDVDIQRCGADEPAIVKLQNGDLFMIFRTYDHHPWETVSHDGGQTWEAPGPSRFFGFNSPSDLLRLQDGSILRVWDNSPTSRFPLVASISTDECQTWSAPRVISEPEFDDSGEPLYRTDCYPSAAQADDGTIVLTWWQTTKTEANIGLARFDRQWVEQGSNVPTIVAFGDSVTYGVREGVNEYQTYRERLRYRLKTAGVEVRVVNAGIGGHNTRDALARLERDVLAEAPSMVLLMFGLNDAAMVDGGVDGPVARTEPRVALEDYRANLTEMVRRCKAGGAQVIMCTPNPMSRAYAHSDMGEYARHEDMNYMLREYVQAAREVATEADLAVVDVFDLFTSRPDGLEMIPDGCHPWPEGHALIADALYETIIRALP